MVENFEELTRNEREAVEAAREAVMGLKEPERTKAMQALERVTRASLRAARTRRAKARYDKRRRLLIGAQLPMEEALEIKARAEACGMSCYAYVRELFRRECKRTDVLYRRGR